MLLDLYSFGFRRSGIPHDPSEHGGGFVFDCRCLPNPGKLEEYRQQTGLDQPVQDWLTQQPETEIFVQQLCGLLELSLRRYQVRGFARLMVSCGCTGGQHRSVYVAERLRAHFREWPELECKLTHTERSGWPANPVQDEHVSKL